jgi:aspartate kinase
MAYRQSVRALGSRGDAADGERGILVVKFGGTSVATTARVARAARRVRDLRSRRWRPVVVVSAAGQTTDVLLRHLGAIAAPAAANWHLHPQAREIDRALATGEDRSAAFLAASLGALGIAAVSVRAHEGVLRAEGEHGAATLVSLEAGAIAEAIAGGVVPVISGFQGVRADGELVTLGRGSSDTTAVFVAAALGAAECHIVTDVAGVYDADPRLTPDAHLLPRLSADALVRLVEGGAQVVHPEAARRARACGTALRVYHYASPFHAAGGTRVPAEVAV